MWVLLMSSTVLDIGHTLNSLQGVECKCNTYTRYRYSTQVLWTQDKVHPLELVHIRRRVRTKSKSKIARRSAGRASRYIASTLKCNVNLTVNKLRNSCTVVKFHLTSHLLGFSIKSVFLKFFVHKVRSI
jgi:hypothetical protein